MGKGKKYFIETFGCQMNVRDSEIIRGYLEEIGMTMTKDPSEASFILSILVPLERMLRITCMVSLAMSKFSLIQNLELLSPLRLYDATRSSV